MKLFLALLAVATPLLLTAATPTKSVATPPSVAGAPSTWKVDQTHSSVLFRTLHLGVAHAYGRFNQFSGTIVLDPEAPENSSVTLDVRASSVDTNDEKRDAHLRNADFFSAKEFPDISFKSTKVTKGKQDHLVVVGDLSFHGVTKSITLDIELTGTGEDPWGGTRAGFHTKFEILPSEYEIKFMQEGKMLGPEVELIVSLETVKS